MKSKYNHLYNDEYSCCMGGWNKREVPFNQNTNALEILKTRYANGEISKEEFDKMKKDII